MSFNSETWEWFKTAPLPVVLAISLTLFVGLAGYVRAVEESAKKHETKEKAAVAVAAEQAKTAAEIAKNRRQYFRVRRTGRRGGCHDATRC